MKVYDLSKTNSIIGNMITELRSVDIQQDSMRFRKNLERLGWIFAYELSKKLNYEIMSVETPLGEKEMPLLSDKLVLATVLRAGLPFHQGFLDIFDNAENAFVSAYRKYDEDGTFDIFSGYITSPSLDDKILVITDVMLATAASLIVAHKALKEYGKPDQIHIAAVIASVEGIDALKAYFGNKPVTLWVSAIDEELSAKGYIVPGLGDAGDLAYGGKL
ncbi:MAG: uracil phosphoribosyltransferase [Bacteroidales bacterium]|nr:uracil phosphoribosyltransferase [Bacteroidales bacterium]